MSVETLALVGRPADEIVTTAREGRYDLIVMARGAAAAAVLIVHADKVEEKAA